MPKKETEKKAENVEGDQVKDRVGCQKSCEGRAFNGSPGCGQRLILFISKIRRRRENDCREILVEFQVVDGIHII